MVKFQPVDDLMTRFRATTMRGIIEKRIRQCDAEMEEATTERDELQHRFANAQRKMAAQILADFDHVFPLNDAEAQ